MPSDIFENLLKEQMDVFKESFTNVSRKLFQPNTKSRLTHPGKFGRYREEISKRFLRFVIPSRLEIGDGFLINTNNEVSTQCDIVIFDSKVTPLIQTDSLQRFFPVETTCAVGEIKSTLSKKDCKIALNKLAQIKKMNEHVKSPSIIFKNSARPFSPTSEPEDQLITFLICQKLDFDISELADMYDDDIEYRNRHNLILSIEDGVSLYELGLNEEGSSMHLYPKMLGKELCNAIYSSNHSEYEYFKIFSHYLFMATSHATILYPEFSDYMNYPEQKSV